MKYYFKFILLCFLLMMFQTSCGDSEDSPKGTNDKHLSEDMKSLVGYWKINNQGYIDDYYTDGHTFYEGDAGTIMNICFLFEDGICTNTGIVGRGRNSQATVDNNITTWTYDKSSKVLSFAGIAYCQWKITSMNDTQWSGIALANSNNQAYSAEKDTTSAALMNYYFNNRTTWKCDTVVLNLKIDKVNFRGDQAYYVVLNKSYIDYEGDLSKKAYWYDYGNKTKLYYDKQKDLLYYEIRDSGLDYCTMEIVHPYSYRNAYINFTCRDHNFTFSGKFSPNV